MCLLYCEAERSACAAWASADAQGPQWQAPTRAECIALDQQAGSWRARRAAASRPSAARAGRRIRVQGTRSTRTPRPSRPRRPRSRPRRVGGRGALRVRWKTLTLTPSAAPASGSACARACCRGVGARARRLIRRLRCASAWRRRPRPPAPRRAGRWRAGAPAARIPPMWRPGAPQRLPSARPAAAVRAQHGRPC